MVKISNVSSSMSRSAAISALNTNDQILNGLIQGSNFDLWEIVNLISELGFMQRYLRDITIGNDTITYNNWTEFDIESGYSIWKFPVSNIKYNALNQLFMDDILFENRGQASSESLIAFDKVYDVFDSVYTDDTIEAGTECGTAFCFLQDYDGSTSCLYVGSSTPFNSISFNLEQVASNINLNLYLNNGSNWYSWDGNCIYSGFNDETFNMTQNGNVSYNITGMCWNTCSVNGITKYWAKLTTTTVPNVIPKAYFIMPANSVITMLALSQTQYLNQEYAWCYFSGNIYVTIVNTGDSYYEGNYYIKGSSSDQNKRNYFIYNHQFLINYESSDYVPVSPSFQTLPQWTFETRNPNPPIGLIGVNNSISQVECYMGNGEWRIVA